MAIILLNHNACFSRAVISTKASQSSDNSNITRNSQISPVRIREWNPQIITFSLYCEHTRCRIKYERTWISNPRTIFKT